MTKESDFSIRSASIFSYIFTVVTIFVSIFYTDGFKLAEATDFGQQVLNVVNLLVLILSWIGSIGFLICSIMLTILWIKSELF